MEPWRVCRAEVADSHHFDEEQDPDPDPLYSDKSDPDLQWNENLDPDPQLSDMDLEPFCQGSGGCPIPESLT